MRKREGIEPRNCNETVSADMLRYMESNTQGAKRQGSTGGSPGSMTVACHQGRVGNSGDPANSSHAGVGQYNRQTGRKPDGSWEVGCPHSSDEVE